MKFLSSNRAYPRPWPTDRPVPRNRVDQHPSRAEVTLHTKASTGLAPRFAETVWSCTSRRDPLDDWDRASGARGLGYMLVLADGTRTTMKAAGNTFLSVSSDHRGALGDKQVSLEHLDTGCFEEPRPTSECPRKPPTWERLGPVSSSSHFFMDSVLSHT